jgi:CBS domain containing-hemolysin-like protein
MVDEMFNFFQTHRTRAAIVLGEFGEVLGIVTMKDVLTFFFGEITGRMEDYADFEQDEGGFLVPGDMRLLDFYNLTNIDIDDPVMTTVGGLVFRLFGRLPTAGDTVAYEGYNFTVVEVSGLRISRLRVSGSDTVEPREAPEPRQERETEPVALDTHSLADRSELPEADSEKPGASEEK